MHVLEDVIWHTYIAELDICINIFTYTYTYININISINVFNIYEVHSIKNRDDLLSRTRPNHFFPSSFLTVLTVTFPARSLKISEQIDMLGQLLSSNGIDVKVNKYNILSKVSTPVSVHSLHGPLSYWFYKTDLF